MQLPDSALEKSRYLEHRNEATPQYEAFLNRLAIPLALRLPAGARGIDYGCGPVPVMGALLRERGFSVASYDPFFFPELASGPVDFVTCSEAAEHFHAPLGEFETFDAVLKPGGLLGVMTQTRESWDDFFEWHYPRDPTHVFFYSPQTMQWIARRFGWECEALSASVFIFRKAGS